MYEIQINSNILHCPICLHKEVIINKFDEMAMCEPSRAILLPVVLSSRFPDMKKHIINFFKS